ncbi:MAG: low molecular weight phosphotyrosine protein phosphatase [Lachnospiraceae bacterium]|nr:low molecular weight phosphotyrosine protein phosphatase [Lachnospiraceae bacterium]
MIKILFVCHGNICRSTMAQFVMEDMVKKAGLSKEILIESAATSTEELGNPPHYGTVQKMRELNIPMRKHYATQMRRSDYKNYDFIIGMDEWNYRNIMRIVGKDPDNKVSLLLDYTDEPGTIADPWYTGNFDETYRDVKRGCEGLLKHLMDVRKDFDTSF